MGEGGTHHVPVDVIRGSWELCLLRFIEGFSPAHCWIEGGRPQNGAAGAVYGQDLLHRRGICRGTDDGHGALCTPAFRKSVLPLRCTCAWRGVFPAWSLPPLPLAADSPAPQSCAVSFAFRGQMALKSGLHVTAVDLNKEVSASARPCFPMRTINLNPKP